MGMVVGFGGCCGQAEVYMDVDLNGEGVYVDVDLNGQGGDGVVDLDGRDVYVDVDLEGEDVYVDVDLDGEGGDGVVRGVAEGGLASAGQRPLPRHGLVS